MWPTKHSSIFTKIKTDGVIRIPEEILSRELYFYVISFVGGLIQKIDKKPLTGCLVISLN